MEIFPSDFLSKLANCRPRGSSNYNTPRLTSKEIPILKIKRSHDLGIIIVWNPDTWKDNLYAETEIKILILRADDSNSNPLFATDTNDTSFTLNVTENKKYELTPSKCVYVLGQHIDHDLFFYLFFICIIHMFLGVKS